MRKTFVSGLVVLSLIACGDDSGSDESTDASTSDSSTDASATMTASGDGDGDSSTGDGDSTSGDGDSTSGDGDSTSGDGDGDSTSGDGDGDGDGDTAAVEFVLTSSDFMQGGIIPSLHHSQGGNVSPALDWEGAPAGTMSFGVYFHDLDFQPEGYPYRHSAIWNIASDASGLPQDVDMMAMPPDVPGAVQCRNWFNQFGYGGPGSDSNTYEFVLYALDVADLSEVDQNSALADVKTALDAHAIETVTLSGQTEGPP